MIYPNKKPRRSAGLAKLNRKTCLSRILARIPYLRKIISYHADKKSLEQQREAEKPYVYQTQLERVHKQVRAYYLFGDIGRWPEVAADE